MRKAICIGINDYSHAGASNLDGCVNDMNDWSNMFTTLNFDEIKTLEDYTATKANIKNSLLMMIEQSSAGDDLVMTYSGHGTSLYDTDGDEEDGYDEALYVYNGTIVDDELREIIAHLPDGVNLTIILDSCFSGTATKSASSDRRKIRYVETDKKTRNLRRKKAFLSDIGMKEVLISGCAAYEYSYDAMINGRYNGAFTHYAMACFNPGKKLLDWHTDIRKFLPSIEYPQTPGIFGNDENINKSAFSLDDGGIDHPPIDDGSNKTGCIGKIVKLFK